MTFVDSPKAWVLAFAGCLLLFVTSGSIRINGVLFVALMEAQNLSRGTASWPFNLPGAAMIFAAPLTAVISTRYSTTTLALLASVLFILGQLPCYFTTNIYFMSIFYGLIRGFGVGVFATLVPMVTSTLFKLHRSTAMGLCMAGAPLGGLVMPLLAQFLVLEYDLKGTILLLTGVSMHAFVFSLAYMWYDDLLNLKETTKKPSIKTETERTPLLASSLSRNNEISYLDQSWSEDSNKLSDDDTKCKDTKRTEQKIDIYQNEGKEMSTKDTKCSLVEKLTADKKSSAAVLMNIFRKRGFCFTATNQMVGTCASLIVIQVIIDYALDKGISELLGVYLVTSNSAGDIFGKLCLGLIPDKNVFPIYYHVAFFQMVSAGMAVLLTFSNDFYVLLVITFVFGASQGTCLSSNFVQLLDYVAKDEIPLAISILRVFTGVAFLSIPALIGLFRDKLGSYDQFFYFIGSCLLLFTFVWLIEGMAIKRKKNKMEVVK